MMMNTVLGVEEAGAVEGVEEVGAGVVFFRCYLDRLVVRC